jgi:hypothetical protein
MSHRFCICSEVAMSTENKIDRRTAVIAASTALFVPALAKASPSSEVGQLFTIHAEATTPVDGRRDFDFLHGRWTVAHRNRKPLDADAAWQEFEGVVDCRPVVGGIVNVDDNILHPKAGTYRASTVRIFDPAQKRWSIYWISEKAPGIDPYPVQGRFKDGVGLFYATDPTTTPAVMTRFKWWKITPASARWEQALSNDEGVTWIDNWFMDFSRVG